MTCEWCGSKKTAEKCSNCGFTDQARKPFALWEVFMLVAVCVAIFFLVAYRVQWPN